MQRVSFLLFFICCIGHISLAQNQFFSAKTYPVSQENQGLSRQFKDWKVFQMNTDELEAYVRAEKGDTEFQLSFGDTYSWSLDLLNSDLYGGNYLLRSAEQTYPSERPVAMQGYLAGGNNKRVALTVADNFIYGYVEEGDETYYIEPLRYLTDTENPELFIIYKSSDVIDDGSRTCAVGEAHNHKHDLDHNHSQEEKPGTVAPQAKMMNCYLTELAIASDFSMFQKYGSVAGVEAHNVGVMNNAATDYDDAFNDEIQFMIVEQYVATNTAEDPWTSSTDPQDLLPNFRDWGNAGGFVNQFDLGQHWSDRDFDGTTIGLAYGGVVCTGFRYHVLQDFTNNAAFKRVLTSHEIGHNFDQDHDASGAPFIMAPAVSAVTEWSPASIAGVDGYVPGLSCLSSCLPVSAAFSANNTNICPGNIVSFSDNSTNIPSSWSWSFPGGTPSSSTEQNPVVVYETEGTYNVSLTASNNVGGDSFTQNGFITVSSNGSGFFFYEDFEDGGAGWGVDNPDNGLTWQLASVQGLQSGSTAAAMANFSYNAIGQRDALVSPSIDFSGKTEPELQIEYAYTNYDASLNDSLIVQISTDDGANFYRVFAAGENGGGTLATRPATLSSFSPSEASDWCFAGNFGSGCLNIPLGNINSSTVRIRIENYCGFGNNMYVASVGVFSTCQPAVVPTAIFSTNQTQGCTPFEVQYSDNSQGFPAEYTWSFPGGTPSASNAANPVVIYSSPGTYSATLTVSNTAGTDSQTQNNLITVNEVSTPIFSFNASSLTVDFTDESVNADSYSWDFGDSGTSTSPNPQHTYTTEGTYTVILTTTNECGSNTTSQEVTVEAQPVAAFAAESTEGCAPFTVTYTNNSTGLNGVPAWEFPGGNPATSSAANPTVTYNNPGSYSATLTVSNSAGSDAQTQSDIITVNDIPTAAFSFNPDELSVTFSNSSDNADSYSWDFGDTNSSTEINPTHLYANEGTYTVVLTSTNECGSNSTEIEVEVSVTPTAPSAAFTSNIIEGCEPLTVEFSNLSSANAETYNWTFAGGTPSTSTETNPVVVFNNPGLYSVSLTAGNAVGNNTSTQTDYITVNPLPSAAFSVEVDDLSLDFTNNSTAGNSYSWDFGDGNGSTQESPSHTYAQDGTYTVVLTVTNDCGTISETMEVIVATAPTAAFISDVTTGCEPLTVQFTGQASPNTDTYNWSFPGGTPATSTDANPTVVYNAPGSFAVSLSVANEVGTDLAELTSYVVVDPLPTAAFTPVANELTVTFNNESQDGVNYTWDFGDTGLSSETNPSHTYANEGTYAVTLIAGNDCGTEQITQEVTVSLTPVAPTAAFSFSESEGCAPLTVQFTNQSSANAESYAWEFTGGTPAVSSDPNPTVVYNGAGTFSAVLTVSNAVGSDISTQSDIITVNDLPSADFNFSTDILAVDFTSTADNADTYAWDFGDMNTGDEANPSHAYGAEGTYLVTLAVTNECGTTEMSKEVSVSLAPTAPTAGFSLDASEDCAPLTISLTNLSSDNAETYLWEVSGPVTETSEDENPVFILSQAGIYSVSLTATNEIGSDTQTQTDVVVVNDVPTASFSSSVSDNTISFFDNSIGADTYSWDFGDNSTSTEPSPTHTYANAGSYVVTLTVSNACGNAEWMQVVIVGAMMPEGAFSADTEAGCVPLTVQFFDDSTEDPEEWAWTFEGGTPATSTEQNPIVVFENPGDFTVDLLVTNSVGSANVSQNEFIEALGAPVPQFALSSDGLIVSTLNSGASTGETYLWDFGDGFTTTAVSPAHLYDAPGTYTISLTVTNECGSGISEQTISISQTSLSEIPFLEAFDIFPNPNQGVFSLTLLGNGTQDLNLQLVNVVGQVIEEENIQFSGSLSREFRQSNLPTGMYFVVLRAGDRVAYRKVVIE